MHETRFRDVVTGELDLNGGDVDAGDAMAPCQLTRRGYAAPAAELEDVCAVGKTRVEVADPLHRRRRDLTRPFRVAQSDRVVAARDDLFRFPCDGAACHLPHARRVTASRG